MYGIERFAQGLSDTMRVHLAVKKGPPGTLPGVTVAGADIRDLPDADGLIIPADADGERLYDLPRTKGLPILLFQGYGAPGNPVVTANLQRADVVLAIASWLVDSAHGHGCRTFYVPHGIDRHLYRPGREARERPAGVAMLCHAPDWKGSADGLTALRIVRRAVPKLQIHLFGPPPPPADFPFLEDPARDTVSDLFRQAAVYVCPSWEEGLGLPGLEALSCGAALATTDTRGSRDYAFHGRTALVSPPRDPEALASHTITLLRDTELRGRLAGAGQEYVRQHFGTWAQACARMGDVLHQVV